MVDFQIPSVGVVGLGQIGGSIALNLASKTEVHFFTPSIESRQAGIEAGLVSCDTLEELSATSRLIFVCVPVDKCISVIEELLPLLGSGHIITDVGSTKMSVMEWSRDVNWPRGVSFIGGHPMAGNAIAGFAGASPDLFFERSWILMSDNIENVKDVEAFVTLASVLTDAFRARISVSVAAKHDQAVAYISHLEHLVALCLVDLVRTTENPKFLTSLLGGSFLDATRVAQSPSSMVIPFLRDSRFLREAGERFVEDLLQLIHLPNDETLALERWNEAAIYRRGLPREQQPMESIVIDDIAEAMSIFSGLSAQGKLICDFQRQSDKLIIKVS